MVKITVRTTRGRSMEERGDVFFFDGGGGKGGCERGKERKRGEANEDVVVG